MTIELSAETEALIRQEAVRQGRAIDELIDSLIREAIARDRREFEETVAGIERGWKAAEEGSVRPLSEYMADVLERRASRETAG